MTLPNRARGEVALQINGAPRILCVTLGALAQLEAAFEVASFASLGERLVTMNAHDLLIVVSALTGPDGLSVADLAQARIDAKDAARAVAAAFSLAFDES